MKWGHGGESMWETHAKPEPEERGKATVQGSGDEPWPNAAASTCKPNISVLLQVSGRSPGQPVSLQGLEQIWQENPPAPACDGSRKPGTPGQGEAGNGEDEGEGPLSQLREEQRWEISLTSRPGEK